MASALGYWRFGAITERAAVVPRAPVVPVLRPQPPIAATPGSGSLSSAAPSPCRSCLFNGAGGTQNNVATPVGGIGGHAYITPPKPALSLVATPAASSSSSSSSEESPARTPQDLAVFLETYGPTLLLALAALVVVSLATRRS